MESVTRDGSTRLGRGRAIALKKRGPFSNFRPSVGQHNLSRSACIRVPLKLIKITVEAGLLAASIISNLVFSHGHVKILEMAMRGTRTTSVDSLISCVIYACMYDRLDYDIMGMISYLKL